MSTTLRFLGVAGFVIAGPRWTVVVDPYVTYPGSTIGLADIGRPDAILVSHAAYDHMGDAIALAKATKSPVVCGQDVRALMLEQGIPATQVQPAIWGVRVRVGAVEVQPVECHHWSTAVLADGRMVTGTPLGFIIETEPGVRIYHYGDTAVFGDMRLLGELYRPTVALLGCTQPRRLFVLEQGQMAGTELTGEMTPAHAGLAAELLGVDYAVAAHYLDPSGSEAEDLAAFVQEVRARDRTGRRRPIVLQVGETLAIEAQAQKTIAITE